MVIMFLVVMSVALLVTRCSAFVPKTTPNVCTLPSMIPRVSFPFPYCLFFFRLHFFYALVIFSIVRVLHNTKELKSSIKNDFGLPFLPAAYFNQTLYPILFLDLLLLHHLPLRSFIPTQRELENVCI